MMQDLCLKYGQWLQNLWQPSPTPLQALNRQRTALDFPAIPRISYPKDDSSFAL